MKKDINYICIPIIVLLVLSFLSGLTINSIVLNPFGIFGSIILLGAIVFTAFAMSTKPLLIIGMLVICFVSKCFIGTFSYYNFNSWSSLANGIVSGLFLNIANVLATIYLIWNICAIFVEKQYKQVVSTTSNISESDDQLSLDAIDAMSQELQQNKYLLDNGILSDEEFDSEKANILEKYGFTQSVIQAQPTEQYAQSNWFSNVDGTYKYSDLLLTLSNERYDFKKVNSDVPLMSGTYIWDSTKEVVSLSKPDKSLMLLSIDEDGNLVTSKGYVYQKQ